jgi:hypothetical protein
MGFKFVDETVIKKVMENLKVTKTDDSIEITLPPLEYYYNDENLFRITKEDVAEKIRGYVSIPIYWSQEDGEFFIDTDSMVEEFQRTVSGIESELEQLSLK